MAPDFVVEDHRRPALLASLSGADYVASVRALVDLRPDATFRVDHVLALDGGRLLQVGRWSGGEAAGTFEIPFVNVATLGPEGARRLHVYDFDQLDEARARFDALGRIGAARARRRSRVVD